MIRRRLACVFVIASWALTGCGDGSGSSDTVASPEARPDDEFCESMEHLIVLLRPSGATSPQETEAAFAEAGRWFDQARRSAPPSISEDVEIYASAYEEYVQLLAQSGFNLDVVFSTTEGRDLAIEASHTLTVPIVEYTTNECGLSFGDEA